MPSLSVRIDLETGGRIGPGKIELLEQIASLGSISAAGRALGMSYRRAWELVDDTNQIFGQAVAERQIGGKGGGGATLTPFGVSLVSHYRAIERAAEDIARTHIEALQIEVKAGAQAKSPVRETA
ncbi:winged helix-turn-helix domain-containing protein [Beijerinckia sp. L45]|uniref:winged helix-turn-helix domain-containing protein n=1 Tax=Beijerinckia sp. L45 TaxID=1641855 RepID=UPI00131E2C42|nr:LysR family transcriptional regulator [Beijerinckia sp. L45]